MRSKMCYNTHNSLQERGFGHGVRALGSNPGNVDVYLIERRGL